MTQNTNVKRWLINLFKLYVIWTILYLPIAFMWDIAAFIIGEHIIISKMRLISILIFGYWHLWFITALIISAILMKITYKSSTSSLILLSILLFSIGTIIQYASGYGIITRTGFFATDDAIRNAVFLGSPLFLIGYKLKEYFHEITNNRVLNNNYFMIFSIILVIIESSINYFNARLPLDFMFTVPLATITIFLFCFRYENLYFKHINSAGLSVDIYFIHVMILCLLQFFFPLNWFSLFLLTLLLSIIFYFLKCRFIKAIK